MFDLFFLPFEDEEECHICIMMIDHFTKYKWGGVMNAKTMTNVADFLVSVFQQEGNCERWHCDNGREFINSAVTQARLLLNIPSQTTGRPRHPQCQGLVERANGTCKRKILMKAHGDGLRNGEEKWNWAGYLKEVLMQENDAPLKVYNGLSAFFCLRNRSRDIVNNMAPNPEDLAQLHKFMQECQEEQGTNMKNTGVLECYVVGEHVKVRAGHRDVKKRLTLGVWTTEAKI